MTFWMVHNVMLGRGEIPLNPPLRKGDLPHSLIPILTFPLTKGEGTRFPSPSGRGAGGEGCPPLVKGGWGDLDAPPPLPSDSERQPQGLSNSICRYFTL